jgi:hypothetical protein
MLPPLVFPGLSLARTLRLTCHFYARFGAKLLARKQRSSLFLPKNGQRKSFFLRSSPSRIRFQLLLRILVQGIWIRDYKTFYFCNLQMFVISWSVCPCQAFPC